MSETVNRSLRLPLVAGEVDRHEEHMGLWYGDWDAPRLVALVAPPREGRFVVQIVMPDIDPDASEAIRRAVDELHFYLVDLGERDPWAYAAYHCGTGANVYSPIHWSRFPYGANPDGSAVPDPPLPPRRSRG